jgi:hypothetical protein
MRLDPKIDTAKRMNSVEAARQLAHFEKRHSLLPSGKKYLCKA